MVSKIYLSLLSMIIGRVFNDVTSDAELTPAQLQSGASTAINSLEFAKKYYYMFPRVDDGRIPAMTTTFTANSASDVTSRYTDLTTLKAQIKELRIKIAHSKDIETWLTTGDGSRIEDYVDARPALNRPIRSTDGADVIAVDGRPAAEGGALPGGQKLGGQSPEQMEPPVIANEQEEQGSDVPQPVAPPTEDQKKKIAVKEFQKFINTKIEEIATDIVNKVNSLKTVLGGLTSQYAAQKDEIKKIFAQLVDFELRVYQPTETDMLLATYVTSAQTRITRIKSTLLLHAASYSVCPLVDFESNGSDTGEVSVSSWIPILVIMLIVIFMTLTTLFVIQFNRHQNAEENATPSQV